MAFDLGFKAERGGTVWLYADSDFAAGLERSSGGDWPETSTVELRFIGNDIHNPIAVWQSVNDGATTRWAVDEVEVKAVLAQSPTSVRLHYVDGETDLLWAVKRVGTL